MMFVVSPVALSSGIYKWTDENGKVHYGSRRPEDSQAEKLKIHVQPPSPAPEKTKDVTEVDKADPTVDDKARQERVAYCKSEKKRLKTAETSKTIHERDASGKIIKLASDERNQRIRKIRDNISKYCK